jgi:hypothetical protein
MRAYIVVERISWILFDPQQGVRLRERWRFDQDDEPTVGLEGADEQDRVLIDDYDPKYVRHMMTLLSNPTIKPSQQITRLL